MVELAASQALEVFVSHRNARLTVHGRRLLVHRVGELGMPVAHVARAMGISRQCAHRWGARFDAQGDAGLEDRPPRPHSTPTRTPTDVEARIVAARLEHRLDYGSASKPQIAWDDRDAKTALVTALVSDARTVIDVLDGIVLSDEQADAVGLLALVAGQDVEPGETEGTWRIARRVAPDRVISVVDPDSRHMHKSRSEYRDGYKAHVAVEPDTGQRGTSPTGLRTQTRVTGSLPSHAGCSVRPFPRPTTTPRPDAEAASSTASYSASSRARRTLGCSTV
jgi:hypothetical protein